MPTAPQEAIDRGLETFLALIRENPELSAEFEASLPEFFPAGAPTGDPRETLLAARRHVEWFVLERISRTLHGSPVEILLEEWKARTSADEERDEPAFLNSFTGIFVVTSVQDSAGMWLRDIVGFGEYPVSDPEGAALLREDDLIAGRMFPIEDSVHHLSRAAAYFRDDVLREAVKRDIESLRESLGHGRVYHVSQLEIEQMFFTAKPQPKSAGPDPVAAARTLLAKSGIDDARAEELLARLAQEPYDGGRLIHGAGDQLAEILDELAFETEIDISDARRTIVQAWHSLAGPTPEEVQPEPESQEQIDASAALEAFDKGRKADADLEILISNLARDLDVDADDDSDEEESPAPDFPGVVGAMIEEFFWEIAAEHGADERQRLAPLTKLGRFARELGTFEALTAAELLRFTTFWLHEEREIASEEEGRVLVDALESFCAWAEEAHGMPLREEFGPTLERLRASLPPIAAVNTLIPRPEEGAVGELYEVRDALDSGARLLLDRAGNEHSAYLAPELAERLPQGARLRGRIQPDSHAVVFCCYPPESEGLLGS
jgi:hypothetical protein